MRDRGWWGLGALVLAAGCNTLLGIEPGKLERGSAGSSATGGAVSAGGAAGAAAQGGASAGESARGGAAGAENEAGGAAGATGAVGGEGGAGGTAGAGPDCNAGEYRCVGARLEVCKVDGRGFELDEECPSAELCGAADQKCYTCVPLTAACHDAETRVQCDAAGEPETPVPCPGPSPSCTGAGDCANCTDPAEHCAVPPECYRATCVAGVCGQEPLEAGTPCGSEAGLTCDGNGVCDRCEAGQRDCGLLGNTPRECGSDRQWHYLPPCEGATPICSGGACVAPPSCQDLLEECGRNFNQSCCDSAIVPGGSFMMGDATSEPEDEKPERDTYVSEFRLDLFEVTVGRFRKFVEQYSGPPPDGAGANPNLEGTGWNSAWDDYLPADRESLEAQIVDSAYCTWTPTPNEETRPINCISWHLAFAFCIYDLGRLPTEAEWERAAAGGEEDRPYPWEPTEYSEPTSDLAVYDCPAGCAGLGPYDIGFVGSKPAGAGRYGHLDLAGSVSEWVLDWYRVDYYSHADFCTDCVNLSKPASNARRVLRGGNYQSDTDLLRAAKRDMSIPEAVSGNSPHGVRCAR